MAVNIKFPSPTAVQVPQLYNYTYDQLNRITAMDVYRGYNNLTNSWSGISTTTDYKERISYDGNGNILKYLRNGHSSISTNMDSLTYNYYSNTNRLKYVKDNVADNVYTTASGDIEDINNQTNTSNYTYTEIGNLKSDAKDSIKLIKWNVYGKITEIQRTASAARPITNIKYTYDAAGNRISKRIVRNSNNIAEYTWYVRDAQGNVMGTYFGSGAMSNQLFLSNYTLTLTDQHIYGSSRVGVLNRNIDVKTAFVNPSITIFERGRKNYELSNHLGNVLATISDKKVGVDDQSDGTIDHYTADLVTANDYYPFGMMMPGRKYFAGTGYRYGFNGKENDNDIKGEGNQQDYGMRIYDPRLGKFLSVDPLTSKYPMLTPYQFASNTPIGAIDLDGLESFAVYNKATGQLYLIPDISHYNPQLKLKFVPASEYKNLTDDDKSKSNYGILVKNVFTGGHVENGQIVHNDPNKPKEKPISTGSYNILENKGHTDPSHTYFVLDPQDDSPYDKVDDRPGELDAKGEKRDGYNLHPGRLSLGCVTICKDDPNMTVEQRADEWIIINKAINSTKKEQVPDRRGRHKIIPFATQTKFGKLDVIDTEGPFKIKITVPKTQSKPAPATPPIITPIKPPAGG